MAVLDRAQGEVHPNGEQWTNLGEAAFDFGTGAALSLAFAGAAHISSKIFPGVESPFSKPSGVPYKFQYLPKGNLMDAKGGIKPAYNTNIRLPGQSLVPTAGLYKSSSDYAFSTAEEVFSQKISEMREEP